jgi:hypothetical protein
MIWACAGYLRARFSLSEMIIPCESNIQGDSEACIPHMGSQLQTSCKEELAQSREGAKEKRRKRRTSGNQAE